MVTDRAPECNCGTSTPCAGPDGHRYGCLLRTWQVSQDRKRLADVKARLWGNP